MTLLYRDDSTRRPCTSRHFLNRWINNSLALCNVSGVISLHSQWAIVSRRLSVTPYFLATLKLKCLPNQRLFNVNRLILFCKERRGASTDAIKNIWFHSNRRKTLMSFVCPLHVHLQENHYHQNVPLSKPFDFIWNIFRIYVLQQWRKSRWQYVVTHPLYTYTHIHAYTTTFRWANSLDRSRFDCFFVFSFLCFPSFYQLETHDPSYPHA